jgi:hypothetical protein
LTPLEVDGRVGGAIAATETHVLVFGGSSISDGVRISRQDGTVLDRSTEAWNAIAPAPFSEALFAPGVVAYGEDFIVLGHPCERVASSLEIAMCSATDLEAALYAPRLNSWRKLPPPPVKADGRTPVAVTGLGVRGDVVTFEINARSPIVQYHGSNDLWAVVPRAAGIVDPYCGLPDGSVIAIGGPDVAAQEPEINSTNAYVVRDDRWVAVTDKLKLDESTPSRVACGATAAAVLEDATPEADGRIAWADPDGDSVRWQTLPSPVPAGALVAIGQSATGVRVLSINDSPKAAVFAMSPGETSWTEISAHRADRVVRAGTSLLAVDEQQTLLRLWEVL